MPPGVATTYEEPLLETYHPPPVPAGEKGLGRRRKKQSLWEGDDGESALPRVADASYLVASLSCLSHIRFFLAMQRTTPAATLMRTTTTGLGRRH